MPLAPGLEAVVTHQVTEADTARVLGSGDLPVLGTPALLALAERATIAAVATAVLPEATTVGARVQLDHLRASPVGAMITVTARLIAVDGRALRFEVAAEDGNGTLIGHGEIRRVVVDRERFLTRLD
ncbi:MAG TPA: hotdog domain-containing protein [Actinomycetes bacterium]|jgi:predicted thioesterase|nr:hotdog domain-containing protein [Actinomycetes bacterium]